MQNYWKLRAALSDHRLTLTALEAEAGKAQERLRAAFVEAGLDPAKHYTVDDTAEQFTEQEPDGPAAV